MIYDMNRMVKLRKRKITCASVILLCANATVRVCVCVHRKIVNRIAGEQLQLSFGSTLVYGLMPLC